MLKNEELEKIKLRRKAVSLLSFKQMHSSFNEKLQASLITKSIGYKIQTFPPTCTIDNVNDYP